MTLLEALATLGEEYTIALLRDGILKLKGNFKGREAEVVSGLDDGEWFHA
jgi:hypothetical protein